MSVVCDGFCKVVCGKDIVVVKFGVKDWVKLVFWL